MANEDIFIGGTPSASGVYSASYLIEFLFDKSPTTRWGASAGPPAWAQYTRTEHKTAYEMTITPYFGRVKDFRLARSNDNHETEDIVFSGQCENNGLPQTFLIESEEGYKSDRLYIDSYWGTSIVIIYEWVLFGHTPIGIEISSALTEKWGYPLESALTEKWGDAIAVQKGLNIFWQSSRFLQSGCKQAWGDALQIGNSLVETYDLLNNPQAGLLQRWLISEAAIASGLVENFDIKDTDLVASGLNQFWNVLEDGIILQSPVFMITIGGISLRSITECFAGLDEEQAFNSATIKIVDRGEFSVIAKGHDVTITQFGLSFEYFVSGKDSGWAVTGSTDGPRYQEQFTIRCESKTAALHRPYAADLNKDWPAGGSAATLIQELADTEGITVDFQAADFLVPPNYLVAEKETPWEIIQKITGPLLLTEQTSPGGVLIIRESYPSRPATWAISIPAYSLSADGGFYTYAEQYNDDQIVYNMVSVQDDESASTETLTLEAEDITSQEKYIRAWQVPWVGNFVLNHSGGSHVIIYKDGIQQLSLTDIIEIIDGVGSTKKPNYSITNTNYLRANLGAVEFLEDGTVTTYIAGNSLLEITYITQYYQFRVRDNLVEKLQVYVNGVLA